MQHLEVYKITSSASLQGPQLELVSCAGIIGKKLKVLSCRFRPQGFQSNQPLLELLS